MDADQLTAQALTGITRLQTDPHDPVGRGLLGEAVARLTEHDACPDWVGDAASTLLHPRMPEPVRTERLLLRPLRRDDLEDLLDLLGRDEVTEHLLFDSLSREAVRARIDRELDPPPGPLRATVLAAELDGRVVGEFSLHHQPPLFSHVELGWVLHPDVQGRGLATEAGRALLEVAFEHHGAHRVVAHLDARNTASAMLCERLGMRLEQQAVQDWWSKGAWTSSLGYAILREEWAARPGM